MTNTEILNLIYEASADTAPVVVQFGRVIGTTVYHDHIVIKAAPPAIITKLVEAGCSIAICSDGAEIYNF